MIRDMLVSGKLAMKELRPICGIYGIICKENKKMYIGRSTNLIYRLCQHVGALLNEHSSNIELQDDFNNYGITAFDFQILRECEPNELVDLEWEITVDYRINGTCLYGQLAEGAKLQYEKYGERPKPYRGYQKVK